ncbi:cytochrome c oxidase assembly protein [Nonomuraea angiospora]|uniref:Copper resistance protein D n=1 Tax=Nonomuraea angiospora TaxID=46172 RepID=A0ABR9LSJ2_9ACTN|nr:cytochrome c oxidase assembly protein [Nonomuraea angiospora]MBE1583607.1 putative copper resistance protein D [Nonomuraea angiospora]
MRAATRVYAGSVVAAGVVVLVAAVRFGGAGAEPAIAGLPTAGPVTEWALPLVKLCYDLCAVATLGTLLAAVVLAPAGSPEKGACLRAARWWALGWAVTAALSYPLTMSYVLPLPVTDLLADPGLLQYGLTIPQARALLPVLGAITMVVLATRLPRLPGWVALAIAAFGLLPPAYVGHAASAADHDVAVSALTVHLIAVSLWVGGLGAVLIHFRRAGDLRAVLSRFSTIALCCFAAVAVSGAVGAWVRLSAVSDLWRTEYGQFLLAKTAALVLLGLFGWTHRSRTVARAADGSGAVAHVADRSGTVASVADGSGTGTHVADHSGTVAHIADRSRTVAHVADRSRTVAHVADRSVRHVFVRLAAGELIVMMAAIGLAVGLSRTPPPPPPPGVADAHERLLEYDLPPFTPGALLTELRPDPLILLCLALPAVGYLVGVRRAGDWPLGRTLAWYAGLALLALVLLSGIGGYARAMLSVQALQHVVLAVVAPLLLCLGAPLTLAARATTESSQYGDLGAWLRKRRLSFLALLPAAYMVAFPLLYRTGWLAWSLAGHAAHLLTMALFLGGGLLVFWVLAGADPVPRPVSRPLRAGLLGGVLLVQLAVGAYLLLGPPVAADWFYLVGPDGAPDLFTDQQLAGAVHLLVPLLPLALLAVRLARHAPRP